MRVRTVFGRSGFPNWSSPDFRQAAAGQLWHRSLTRPRGTGRGEFRGEVSRTELVRLVHATGNSLRSDRRVRRDEAAFRFQTVVLVAILPVAWWLAADCTGFALLVGSWKRRARQYRHRSGRRLHRARGTRPRRQGQGRRLGDGDDRDDHCRRRLARGDRRSPCHLITRCGAAGSVAFELLVDRRLGHMVVVVRQRLHPDTDNDLLNL